jgi:O-acetylserine/cysteine efflux transporter
MTPLHKCLAVLVSLLWGLNFIAAKTALTHFPIFMMLGVRMLIVAVMILPFTKRPNLPWTTLLVLGFTMSLLNTALGYSALTLGLNASVAIIIDQLRVPFSVLLGMVILKERLRWRTALGISITFIGTFFIVKSPENIGNLLAVFCSLGGALGWALYNMHIKQLGKVDVFALLGTISLLGALQLFICSLLFEHDQLTLLLTTPWPPLAGILYMSIGGMVIGQGLWFYLLHHYDVGEVTPYSLLVTVFGVSSSIILLGESFTLPVMIGSVITILGVAIIILRRPEVVAIGVNE